MRRALFAALVLFGCRGNESSPPIVVAPVTPVPESAPPPIRPVPKDDEPPALPKEGRAGKVGAPAPEVGGNPIAPATRLELAPGHVSIVHFWATWCAPCQKSLPELEKIAGRGRSASIDVVALSVDDETNDVPTFVRQYGIRTTRVGWDDAHASAERWQVQTMPMTYVVDRQGIVRFVHPGWHDGEEAVLAREAESLSR